MIALNLSVLERNDSKLLTFTDTTVGWGTGGDPDVIAIAARTSQTYSLTLSVTIHQPNSSIIYDLIDLYGKGLATPFTGQTDLVFALNASNFTVNGNPLGDSTTNLPDGIYDLTYKIQHYVTGSWVDINSITMYILVYGQVKSQVYDKLRQIPILYQYTTPPRDILEAELYNTFLQSIEKSAYIAKKTELIDMLETLQRLLLNGSTYPW